MKSQPKYIPNVVLEEFVKEFVWPENTQSTSLKRNCIFATKLEPTTIYCNVVLFAVAKPGATIIKDLHWVLILKLAGQMLNDSLCFNKYNWCL